MNPVRLVRCRLCKRPRAPIARVHFVTNRCNARCGHCFVDRTRPMFSGDELSVDEIKRVADSLRGRVYHVSLAGGEPTLREDLAAIVDAYAQRAQVRSMLIVSNGSLPEALAHACEHALLAHPRVDLITSLSIDEIGDAHDAMRGLPGLFERVLETYRRLVPLKSKGLSLNVNFTLTHHNQDRALDVLDEAMRLLPDASFSLTAVRGAAARAEAVRIAPERYRAVAELLRDRSDSGPLPELYENFSFGRRILNARKELLRAEIGRGLAGRRPRGACYAAKLTGVLMANGAVYPCELLSDSMGNVRDFDCDFAALWRSRRAEDVRQSIDVARCGCTYECAWGVNVVFGPRHWPRLLAALVRQRSTPPCVR